MSDSAFVLFRFSGGEAAIAQGAVAEVLPLARLDRPAGAPATLAGFLNLGGEATPVLRLERLLAGGGEEPVDDLDAHILRLRPRHGHSLALIVERVEDAAARAEAVSDVEPDQSVNGCVAATLTIAGRFVPLLDVDRLLLAEEEARLTELATAAQARISEWSAA